MLFGILSVVSATSQHRTVGLVNDPTALRLWLSKGKPSETHRTSGDKAYPHPYDTLPLESSVSASLVTRFPSLSLNLAAFLYVVGFALYLIFSWKEQVPNGTMEYRNIFLVFMASIGLSILYYSICFVDRVIDAAKVSNDFQFQRLGTIVHDSEGLQELNARLGTFQEERGLASELKKLTMEIIELRQAIQGVNV